MLENSARKRNLALTDDFPNKQQKKHDDLKWSFSEEDEGKFDTMSSEDESDSDDETDHESITIQIRGPNGDLHELQKELNKAKDSTGTIFFVSKIGYESEVKPQTKAELEVCGGCIYALLMGEGQPSYFMGQDDKGSYYRLSSKVNFEAEGLDIFNFKQPISRFIFSLVISYFLGDNDISNVGVVKKDNQLLVVRIDPECCFSNYFLQSNHNQLDKVLAELGFLDKLNTENASNKDHLGLFLEKEHNVEFFRSCFNHKLLTNQESLNLLSSPAKNKELREALNKIIGTPIEDYEKIIDKTVSDPNKRVEVKNALKNRLKIFEEAWNHIQKEKEEHFLESKNLFRLFSSNRQDLKSNLRESCLPRCEY
ncbi:MAG: hypothetical protein P4L79_16535 [Legionella sp.]|uniref:hypothetical protein n=1 Tax=Legionella sp. TaxID=459 RepID=UPI002849B5B9|nr:hypothetical protein [Legionella sp.]